MSQLFRDLDLGTGSEPRHRIIPVGAAVVQFNLEHGGLLPLEETTSKKRRPVTCISRANNEMCRQNKLRSAGTKHKTLAVKHSL